MTWRRLVLAVVLAALALVAGTATAIAGTSQEVTITATPNVGQPGVPSNLTLTDLGFVTVQADWSAAANATYYMLRGSRDDYPTLVTEGELLAYVSATSANFTSVDLNINTGYVSLWAYSSDNSTYNPSYLTASIGGEPMEDMGANMGLLALIILPVGLLYAMVRAREPMLGFPAGISWWILGAFAYGQSSTPWGDWQYYLFFASMFFGVFSIYAAYALRKKDLDSRKQDFLDYGPYVDEQSPRRRGGNGHEGTDDLGADIAFDSEEETVGRRSREIRERASRRRSSGIKQSLKWGEFK